MASLGHPNLTPPNSDDISGPFPKVVGLHENADQPPMESEELLARADEHVAQGNFDRAVELYSAVLDAFEDGVGVESTEVAWVLTKIGETYRVQANYDAAEDALKRSLVILDAVVDSGDASRIGLLNALSSLYSEWGHTVQDSEEARSKKVLSVKYNRISVGLARHQAKNISDRIGLFLVWAGALFLENVLAFLYKSKDTFLGALLFGILWGTCFGLLASGVSAVVFGIQCLRGALTLPTAFLCIGTVFACFPALGVILGIIRRICNGLRK